MIFKRVFDCITLAVVADHPNTAFKFIDTKTSDGLVALTENEFRWFVVKCYQRKPGVYNSECYNLSFSDNLSLSVSCDNISVRIRFTDHQLHSIALCWAEIQNAVLMYYIHNI